MEIFILVFFVLLGFILLASNSIRKMKMVDTMLFSILLVLSGLSFTEFAEEGFIFYFGVSLTFVGFIIGTVRFFIEERSETENL